MDERSMDLIELKKKILLPYLDFVEETLKKVKGTNIEDKWKIMHECITSDKKRPSYEKIKQLEKTLIDLKNKLKQRSTTVDSSSKPNANQNQLPSTSKAEGNDLESSKGTDESDLERDPRRRVSAGRTVIYKSRLQDNLEQNPTHPETQISNSPQPLPNNEMFEKDKFVQQQNQNRSQFLNRSLDNCARDRFNRRNSPDYRNKMGDRYNSNKIQSRDDSFFKRKRSESPVVKGHMPKRRFSCYESENNRDKKDSEIGREKPNISRNAFTSNRIETVVSTTQNNTKMTSNESLQSNETKKVQVEQEQTTSKRRYEERRVEATNLADAMKKIQSFKIPKIYDNKNVLNQIKKEHSTLEVRQKETIPQIPENSEIRKDDKEGNKPVCVDKKLQDQQKSAEITKIIKVKQQENNTEKHDVSLEQIKTDNLNEMKSEIDIPIVTSVNSNIDSINTKPSNGSTCIKNSNAQAEVATNILTDKNNDDIVATIESKESNVEQLKVLNKKSKEDDSINDIGSILDLNKKPESVNEKPVAEKASILNNLLETEEENPEKMLEGLISVLGAEKVKKMQELLLKNNLKTDKVEDSNKGEESSMSSDKTLQEDKHEVLNEITPSDELQKPENVSKIDDTMKSSTTTNISKSPKTKTKKKKCRKSELDKLHQDILAGHDYEGIMRACTQPRTCAKTKLFECLVPPVKNVTKTRPASIEQSPPKKYPETKSFSLKLVRLNLTTDDMPVIINDEFINSHLKIGENKSRTVPRSTFKKIFDKTEVNSEIKLANTEPKIELSEVKSEINSASKVVNVESKLKIVEALNSSVHSLEDTLLKEIPPLRIPKKKKIVIQKKKRKLMLWSKGILKKKTKKLSLIRAPEWEDIESSDDEIDFVTVIKLNKFKDVFCKYASEYETKKCGRKKSNKQLKSSEEQETEDVETNVNNSIDEEIIKPSPDEKEKMPIESSILKESSPKPQLYTPKRINLPLDKDFLTMITQSNNAMAAKNLKIAEDLRSKNLNITIKIPEKHALPMLPTVQNQPTEIARELPTQSVLSSPKIVIVKPFSNEMQENIKTRPLDQHEQEALLSALSANKKTVVSSGTPMIQNKQINTSNKINMQKLREAMSKNISSTSQDESVKIKVPMISNVVSINPSATTAKSNITSDGINSKQIISIIDTAVAKSSIGVDSINTVRKQVVVQKPPNAQTTGMSSKMLIEARKFVKKVSVNLPPPPTMNEKTSAKEKVEIVDLIDDDEDDIVDILRPWIEKSEFKSRKQEIEAMKMLNNTHCLASLYKCMGSTCSYYTNDSQIFSLHLELHRDHQSGDSSNYLLCSYCNFRPKSIQLLVMHIDSAHGYAKFGCKYCFYRSVNEYQVTANHHINFHRNKEKCVVVFDPKKFKNENTEKNHISDTIPKVCPALPCPYCRAGFYTTSEFETHVKNHKETYLTNCQKCDVEISKEHVLQHLFKCYDKFGSFQCVFCVFGTSNFSSIDTHLSTQHPDKMSYFAERTLNFGKEPTFVEALTIKELSKKITGNVKKILLNYSFDDETFRNAENFGRLSEDLLFRQKINDPDTFIRIIRKPPPTATETSTSKSILQINQVMSLHD